MRYPHLGLDTVNGLVCALRRYAGAVLLVSHDPHLFVEGGPFLPPSELENGDDSDVNSSTDESERHDPGIVCLVGPRGKVRSIKSVETYVAIVDRKIAKFSS